MEGNKSISIKIWLNEMLGKIYTHAFYVGESRKLTQGTEETATLYQASEDNRDALLDYIRQGAAHISALLNRVAGRTSSSETEQTDTHDALYIGELAQENIYTNAGESHWAIAAEEIKMPIPMIRLKDGSAPSGIVSYTVNMGEAMKMVGSEQHRMIAFSGRAITSSEGESVYCSIGAGENRYLLIRNDGSTAISLSINGNGFDSINEVIPAGNVRMFTLSSTDEGTDEADISIENNSSTDNAIYSLIVTDDRNMVNFFFFRHSDIEIPTLAMTDRGVNIPIWQLCDAPQTPVVAYSISALHNMPDETFREITPMCEDYIVAFALREWSMAIKPDESATFATRMAELDEKIRIMASARSKPTRRAYHTLNPNEIIFE